MKLLPVVCS